MNFNNARTRKRIKSALGMTLGCLDEHKPRELGTRFIDKFYSGQSNATGKWLRSQLLITHNNTWNYVNKRCKTYTYNPQGVQQVKEILGIMNTPAQDIVKEQLQACYDTELKTKKFVYRQAEHSGRLLHPLQNYRREYKRNILAQNNLTHEYDIVCCAPTLLHQFSWQFSHGHVLNAIDDYITNRTVHRQRLADSTDLPVKNIKKVINALFSGGKLAANNYSSLFALCEYDPARMIYLQNDSFICDLKQDIRQMWKYMKPHLESTGIPQINKRYTTYMTPKNKWNVYFSLERSVLDSIRVYLFEQSNDVFLEHDGFTSQRDVDTDLLSEYIKTNTGFDVLFEKKDDLD